MHLPIPDAVLYAGLAGVVLALIVATAQNKWQLRVFVLLALRLAIGWHFCFEGMHKLHSMSVGPAEKNRVFTSEPYFAAGEGPFADIARKQFLADPEAAFAERLGKKQPLTVAEFRAKSEAEQADLCPDKVAVELKEKAAETLALLQAEFDKLKADAAALPAGTDEEKAKKKAAEDKADAAEAKLKPLANDAQPLRAKYAAWVYGAGTRPIKMKNFSGSDLEFTAEQALAHIEQLKTTLSGHAEREKESLGNGYGYEADRVKAIKADLQASKTDLAKETTSFVAELRKDAGLPDLPAAKPDLLHDLKLMDQVVAWIITLVGVGLLLGCFTRLWCVTGIGFLVLTYLSHPTIPGLPLPPNTEGNPLFINKNLIEALGLLVVLVHPTGRWLGLDALWQRGGDKKKTK